jgi:hypothetical protein
MKRIVDAKAEAADSIDDTGPDTRAYGGLILCNSEDQLVSLHILHAILVSGKFIDSASGILSLYPSLSPFSFTCIEAEPNTLGLYAHLCRLRLHPPI